MNSNSRNVPSHQSSSESNPDTLCGPALSSAEATLQLIARLPAPQGLEDRVIAGIHAAPRTGRVLRWPAMMAQRGAPRGGWIRGAAAAAIVFVVAGGGWGIYTRVEPSQPGKVLVMPRSGAPGGFSGAGAIRTPDTLHGPFVVQPASGKSSNGKAAKKSSTHAVHAPQHAVQTATQNSSSAPPKVAIAK